jgi:hypothetical protein
MSTHRSPRRPRGFRIRTGPCLLALIAATAIGYAILVVALLNARTTTSPAAPIPVGTSYTGSPATTTPPRCYFRDPATHALLHVACHHGRHSPNRGRA